MSKLDLLEEPPLRGEFASDPDYNWKQELAKLFRSLTILTVVFINKIKEEKK